MTTKLIEVPGIGPKTAEYLQAQGLATVEDLLQAGIEELMKAPGFHLSRALKPLELWQGGQVRRPPLRVKKPGRQW